VRGGGASVSGGLRPSFAWPAPPQPRYTIDPRHYSYDIWGKAPVFSLTGEDEDEDEDEEEAEAEEEDDAQEEEGAVAARSAEGGFADDALLASRADVI
jgi:hypothetical protein